MSKEYLDKTGLQYLWGKLKSYFVADVKVDNASVVTSGIATIPKSSSSQFGVVKVTHSTTTNSWKSSFQTGDNTFAVPTLDGEYALSNSVLPVATTSLNGAMSAADKSKLNSITMANGIIDTSCLPSFVMTETDPTVPSWAKASSKPSYTASEVGALPLSGGTMTGQLLTSFKSSVAMGSYQATSNTVADLVDEVRMSSGVSGSVNITTAYTNGDISISTGWYNFHYMPHRSGGVNGSASGDNCNYGTLLLIKMTSNSNGRVFFISINSGSINTVHQMLGVTHSTSTTTGLATSWTVTKYSDGYCEAYAVTDSTGYPMTSQYTNGYYYSASQNLPSVFTSVHYAQVDRCAGTSSSGLITASVHTLSTSQIKWYAFDTKSETVNCSFAIRVVGKWK